MIYKKIGIMGGTFNPIHYGHLALANTAYNQFGLDTVWVMPSKVPPHKQHVELISANHRIEMIKAALHGEPFLQLSLFEMHRSGYTYTYDTLQKLHERYPNTQFYFIMGGDSLRSFDSWRKPDVIAKLCILLVANRGLVVSEELSEQMARVTDQFQAQIGLLNIPRMSVSSSEIRRRIADGEAVRELIPPAVEHYIRTHQLYGCSGFDSHTERMDDHAEKTGRAE